MGIKFIIDWDLNSLTYLILGKNKIGCEGAKLLSKAKLPNLAELDLSIQQYKIVGCMIGD